MNFRLVSFVFGNYALERRTSPEDEGSQSGDRRSRAGIWEACYHVVPDQVCPAYPCIADVKALFLQRLET